jgi:hypothetical protein
VYKASELLDLKPGKRILENELLKTELKEQTLELGISEIETRPESAIKPL